MAPKTRNGRVPREEVGIDRGSAVAEYKITSTEIFPMLFTDRGDFILVSPRVFPLFQIGASPLIIHIL